MPDGELKNRIEERFWVKLLPWLWHWSILLTGSNPFMGGSCGSWPNHTTGSVRFSLLVKAFLPGWIDGSGFNQSRQEHLESNFQSIETSSHFMLTNTQWAQLWEIKWRRNYRRISAIEWFVLLKIPLKWICQYKNNEDANVCGPWSAKISLE